LNPHEQRAAQRTSCPVPQAMAHSHVSKIKPAPASPTSQNTY